MFICAMMFVSVQAMNAAEKTASDKAAPKASKECVAEKPEAPSVESCDEMTTHRFVTSCGKKVDMPFDSNTPKEVLSDFMDTLEARMCSNNQVS